MHYFKQSERGYGVVGIFSSIALFVFITYVVIKITTIYYDAFVVHKEVTHLTTTPAGDRSADEIKTYLKRQFEINGVDSVTEENIHVEYDQGQQAYLIHVTAEERARIIHKLFLLIQMDETAKMSK